MKKMPVWLSKAKKVQIFKWLLKKHGCTPGLEFMTVENAVGQKVRLAVPVAVTKTSDPFFGCQPWRFAVEMPKEAPLFKLLSFQHLNGCSSGAISYADVFDEILEQMEKCKSNCFITRTEWRGPNCEIFLERDISWEALLVEFDLAS